MVDLLLKTESPVDEALEILSNIINAIPRENHTPIYLAYAEIYERTQNKLLRAIAIEKAVELNPNDTSMVFNAAHALSEAELPALAITNYETVLRQNPDDDAALNNLGVAFDGLEMPIESVNFYNKSSEKKETLAMSNLAYKYISQGFMADAEKLLKMAQQEKDVHPNVAEAMASIAKQKNSETEKKVEINKVGIKQKNFLKFYADLRFTPKHQEGAFNGKWRFGSEIINIEEKNNTLSAEWGKAPNKQKLQGNITGNSAEITLENQVSYITTYESFTKGNNGLCYIDSNRKTIHIMTLAKYKPKFMEFVLESE